MAKGKTQQRKKQKKAVNILTHVQEKIEEEKKASPKNQNQNTRVDESFFETTLRYPIYSIATGNVDGCGIILIAGGGGTSKTGIPNAIVFIIYVDCQFYL